MAHVTLTAHARTEFGNGPTRRLRRTGLVPGIVYQPGGPSLPLALPDRDLRRALQEGRTGVIDLAVVGERTRPVLVKDWQLHPVRGDVMHVDFQEVDLTQEIEAPIPLMLVGSAVGVREGGVLDQPLREVIVSALPDALPDHLEVDVSELNVGDSVSVGQIAPPAGVVIVTDPETTIASVVAPSAVIVEEEVEEELEGEIVEGADAEGGGPDDE